jgi:2-amino-4-hydroxy-6-hydroxymethyldihydropteridine diphosphokinase
MTVTAYLALGSNLGDRRAYLERALDALRHHEGITVGRVSSLYETRPVGGPAGQGPYLNAAAEVRTDLPPEALLQTLLQIEAGLGRVREERDGPRTIDLDLLLYGNLVSTQGHLTIPHPRLHERLFVLLPLAEIAPGVEHPVLKRTSADLLAELQGVRLAGASPGRELTGQRAMVTGSTSGIGRAIALELAGAGADVIVHGRKSRDAAEEVAGAVRNAGGRSAIVLADLRHPESCLWKSVSDQFSVHQMTDN